MKNVNDIGRRMATSLDLPKKKMRKITTNKIIIRLTQRWHDSPAANPRLPMMKW